MRRLQGPFAESLRVTLASFRKLYDLLSDRRTGWIDAAVGALEGHKSHLESDAHQTNGLGIETVTVQVGPDRHCSEKSSQNLLPVKRKRPRVHEF